MWLLIFFVVGIVYFMWYQKTQEEFDVVPSNSNNVKVMDGDMIERETDLYDEKFRKAYGGVDEMVDSTYNNFPASFVFGYNNIFKEVLLTELKAITEDSSIKLIKDINNIYWRDIGDTRSFVFNIQFSTGRMFVGTLRVNILLKNLGQYGLMSGIQNLDMPVLSINLQDIKIENIDIQRVQKMDNNISAYDQDDIKALYRIRNNLGLMDPFVTDGKDMHIYEYMKTSFNQELNRKEERKMKI